MSTGKGDAGGVSSYGSYQLATNRDRPRQFLETEGRRWAPAFGANKPGSPGFTAAWKRIAEADPVAFQEAQHAFIKRTHFDQQLERVRSAKGIDLRGRSEALDDVIWSTSVQHGPNNDVVLEALSRMQSPPFSPNYERELIENIYDVRKEMFPRTAKRFEVERADALRMLDHQASQAR